MKLVRFVPAAFAVSLVLPAAAAPHPSPVARTQAAIADNEIVSLINTCDANTGLPSPGQGACEGIETLNGSVSGMVDGTYLSAVNYATLADGSTAFTAYNQVTGSVEGLGSGSFVMLEVCDLSTSLDIVCRWTVIPGSGTNALSGLTGQGTTTATYDLNTGLAAGQWNGMLQIKR